VIGFGDLILKMDNRLRGPDPWKDMISPQLPVYKPASIIPVRLYFLIISVLTVQEELNGLLRVL